MDDRLPVPMTFRVMGPHERGRFAPEAWGHLLSLSGSGAINPLELEHIIETRSTTRVGNHSSGGHGHADSAARVL